MTDILNRGAGNLLRHAPKELINIVGTGLAILVAVALGATLASALPADATSPYLFAGCFAAPAAAAFAVYWFVAQKL